jgi:hypothetical protein
MCLQVLKKSILKLLNCTLYFFFGLAVKNTKNFKKNSLSVIQQPDITPGPPVEEVTL